MEWEEIQQNKLRDDKRKAEAARDEIKAENVELMVKIEGLEKELKGERQQLKNEQEAWKEAEKEKARKLAEEAKQKEIDQLVEEVKKLKEEAKISVLSREQPWRGLERPYRKDNADLRDVGSGFSDSGIDDVSVRIPKGTEFNMKRAR
jgi:hypothetical protein